MCFRRVHHFSFRIPTDDYAKNGGPGEVRLLCSFYHESLCTWIKTTVNKFAISNHTVLISGVHALRSYLKLICEHETHSLPNKKLVTQRIMVKTGKRSGGSATRGVCRTI